MTPIKCHFCSARFPGHATPDAREWDWVTGYLPKQEFCCPRCQMVHAAMWVHIVRRAALEKETND